MARARPRFPPLLSLPSVTANGNVQAGGRALSLGLCVITKEHMVSPLGCNGKVA